MADLRAEVAAARDLETANSVFLSAFEAAVASDGLVEFRESCAAILLDPPHPACMPYAFAYEARGYLHDYDLWIAPTGDRDFLPKPQLLDALARCLGRSAAINCRDNYYWLIISALTEFIRGDVETAFRQLALAATYPDLYRVVKCDLGGGAGFAKTYPSRAELAAFRQTPRFGRDAAFVQGFAQPPRLAICTAFDLTYGRAFAQSWIRSVAELTADGVGLHFHAMFRGEIDAPFLAGLAEQARALGVNLAISSEASVSHSNAYFASARFLKGASFLDNAGCPIVLVDADAFIPSTQVFRDTHLPRMLEETRILGLMSYGPWNGYMPWRRFSAGWVLCPNSQAARAFLQTTADCIDYFWDARGSNWWIDQMGLEVGKRAVLATEPSPPRFGQIYTELPQLFDTSEAHKIACISDLPEMQIRLAAGMSYGDALYDMNTPKAA